MHDYRILADTINQLKADNQYIELQSSNEIELIDNFEYYRGKDLSQKQYVDILELSSNKEAYLMILLPHLIDFCHFIHQQTKPDQRVYFKSRDCYFLKKLFDAIYPGERRTEYIYMSRKACYTNSIHYKAYIDHLVADTTSLWVDIQGSGDSHVYYFKTNYNYVPQCIFFRQNTLQRANEMTANYEPKDYEELKTFKTHCWRLFEKDFIDDGTEEAFILESLCRAPHASAIDVDQNFQPIFEKNYDLLDKNLHELMIAYGFILDNYWQDSHFKLRSSLADINQTDSHSQQWNGIAAFDIDETITHDDHGVLEEAFNVCKKEQIKVIFITARWDPFYENHNGKLAEILPRFKGLTNHPIDLWFNPLSRKGNNEFNDMYKSKQLDKARVEHNLKREQCILIDNVKSTIDTAKKHGFVNSVCVPNQTKAGITKDALQMINMIISRK